MVTNHRKPSHSRVLRRGRASDFRALMLHTIIIGIEHYRDELIPDLRQAARDAIDVHRLFDHVPPESPVSQTRLLNEEATHDSITRALGDVSKTMEEGDDVLLYFSGHGCTEQAPDMDGPAIYLAPHDAEGSRLERTAVELYRELPALVEDIRALSGLFLTMLDCCYSGAPGSRSFLGPRHRALYEERAGIFLEFEVPPPLPAAPRSGFGCAVWGAAEKDRVAYESEQLGHGFFTAAFLQAYEARSQGGPPRLLNLVADVEDRVLELTEGQQTPVFSCWKCSRARLPPTALRS